MSTFFLKFIYSLPAHLHEEIEGLMLKLQGREDEALAQLMATAEDLRGGVPGYKSAIELMAMLFCSLGQVRDAKNSPIYRAMVDRLLGLEYNERLLETGLDRIMDVVPADPQEAAERLEQVSAELRASDPEAFEIAEVALARCMSGFLAGIGASEDLQRIPQHFIDEARKEREQPCPNSK